MMQVLNLSTRSDHPRERRTLFLHIVKLATTAIREAENIEHPSNMLIARLQTEMKTAVLFYRGNQEVLRPQPIGAPLGEGSPVTARVLVLVAVLPAVQVRTSPDWNHPSPVQSSPVPSNFALGSDWCTIFAHWSGIVSTGADCDIQQRDF
ncbi:hypothetical protein BDD12DRAFT_947507 [Trichophaea hybrida]|nr:hypothetical protein BDD12DRAFT_947507 [Trichophaea hybrida]